MRIYAFLIFLVLASCSTVNAQTYKPDRPFFAKSGEVLPINTFSLETGSSIEFIDSDNLLFNHIYLDVRIGMMKLMEMTVGLNVPAFYGSAGLEEGRSSIEKNYRAGFASPKLGLKITMKERQEESRMAMAFFGQASLNFGSEEYKDVKILPAFSIAMDIDWNEKTNMRVTYGIVWLENRSVIDPEGNPVIDPFIIVGADVSGRLNEKLSIFGEVFARVKYDNFKSGYYASGGMLFHLKENAILNIRGGAGLSPESSRGFAQVGFSGLWPKKNVPFLMNDE